MTTVLIPTQKDISDAVNSQGGFRQAERFLRKQGYKTSEKTIRRSVEKGIAASLETEGVFAVSKPKPVIDIKKLITDRSENFNKVLTHHNQDRVRTVKVNVSGPIGIGFPSDPHLDDNGADVRTAFAHADLFNGDDPALTAVLLGDLWNNWQGRMARLWAEQGTGSAEAKALVEEYLKRVDWLAVVLGNHDLWSGYNDIITFLLEERQIAVRPWRIDLELQFPNGRKLRIHAAHRFAGRSMWSDVYGAAKKAQLLGNADIYICGDSHVSGFQQGIHPGTGKMWHAVQVGSYKRVDDYADEIGAEDRFLFNCPVCLVDPDAKDQLNFVRWELDAFEGAERLKYMRRDL